MRQRRLSTMVKWAYLIVQGIRCETEPAAPEATPILASCRIEEANAGVDLRRQVGDSESILIPLRLHPVRIARVQPVVIRADKGPGVVGIAIPWLSDGTQIMGPATYLFPTAQLMRGPEHGSPPEDESCRENISSRLLLTETRSFSATNAAGPAMPISPGGER